MQRLAGFQHDVVGDINGQRNRAHAGADEASPHPLRALRGGVEPGDDPRGEPVTPDRILDDDRVGRRVGRGDCHPAGDVMKRSVEGRCRLAG